MAATASTIWYFSDWLAEPTLRMCSLAAKGLWMDMLSLAATANVKGYVMVGDHYAGPDEIATAIGKPASEVKPLFEELEKWGVFSRDSRKRVYCRRMVKGAKASQRNVAGGKARASSNQRDGKGKFKVAGEVRPATTTTSPSTSTPSSSVKDSPVGESSKPAAPPAGPQQELALSPGSAKTPQHEALELYNSCALALSWVSAARLSPSRRKSLDARLKELGPGGWAAMLEKAASLRFFDCRRPREGKHANWRPSLEFFLSSQKAAKIMEGFYDRYGQSTESLHQLTGGARLAALASLGSLDS